MKPTKKANNYPQSEIQLFATLKSNLCFSVDRIYSVSEWVLLNAIDYSYVLFLCLPFCLFIFKWICRSVGLSLTQQPTWCCTRDVLSDEYSTMNNTPNKRRHAIMPWNPHKKCAWFVSSRASQHSPYNKHIAKNASTINLAKLPNFFSLFFWVVWISLLFRQTSIRDPSSISWVLSVVCVGRYNVNHCYSCASRITHVPGVLVSLRFHLNRISLFCLFFAL